MLYNFGNILNDTFNNTFIGKVFVKNSRLLRFDLLELSLSGQYLETTPV